MTAPQPREVSAPLTDRELAVLDLVAGGLITVAIARRLGISPRTVAKHLEQAYRKLDANDRVSAVLRASSLGLIPAQPSRR
jgi:DNA-binding CsgD family transcriptional regulator